MTKRRPDATHSEVYPTIKMLSEEMVDWWCARMEQMRQERNAAAVEDRLVAVLAADIRARYPNVSRIKVDICARELRKEARRKERLSETTVRTNKELDNDSKATDDASASATTYSSQGSSGNGAARRGRA